MVSELFLVGVLEQVHARLLLSQQYVFVNALVLMSYVVTLVAVVLRLFLINDLAVRAQQIHSALGHSGFFGVVVALFQVHMSTIVHFSQQNGLLLAFLLGEPNVT